MASKLKQTKEDLQKKAEALLLPISGTKEQIRDRLALYASISKLTKEELFKRAKKEEIDLRKDTIKELRAEYVKKRSGPINASAPISKSSAPLPVSTTLSNSTSIYILSPEIVSNLPREARAEGPSSSREKEEIDRLKEEKIEWDEEREKLEDEIKYLKALGMNVFRENKKKEEEHSAEIKELEMKLEHEKFEAKHTLDSQTNMYQIEIASLTKKYEDKLLAQAKEFQEIGKNYETRIKKYEDKLLAQAKEFQEIGKNYENKLKKMLSGHNLALHAQARELELVRKEKDDLDAKLQKTKTQLRNTKGILEIWKNDCNLFGKKIEELGDEKSYYEAKIKSLEEDVDSSKSLLELKDQVLSDTSGEVCLLKERAERVERVEELEEEIKRVKKELAEERVLNEISRGSGGMTREEVEFFGL